MKKGNKMYLGEIIAITGLGYIVAVIVSLILRNLKNFIKKLGKAIIKVYISEHYPQIPDSELRKW